MSIDLIKRLRLGTGTSTSPDHELLLEAAKAIEEYRMKYILAAEGKDRAQRRLSELEAQLEELQKQEPVAWMARSGSGTTVLPDERMNKDYYNIPLYTAPIPTPSQQEALDAINQLGGQDPMKAVQTLRDFILARPDATIPPEDLEDMEKRITELEACVAELLGFAGADKARIAELEALRTEHHRQYTENFSKLEAANAKMRKCLESIAEHHKDCLMLDHGALNKLMQLYHTERRDFALEAAK